MQGYSLLPLPKAYTNRKTANPQRPSCAIAGNPFENSGLIG